MYRRASIEAGHHARFGGTSTGWASRPRSTSQKGIYPSHFGLIFVSQEEWQALADRAKAKGLSFYQQPRVRFPGTRIEHRTFFLEDPSRNLLEFKHYTYESAIFGEQDFTEVGDTGGESTD